MAASSNSNPNPNPNPNPTPNPNPNPNPKQAYMYDVRTGRLAATLGGHLEAATDVAFSPLHPQLATVRRAT